jgi:AcrR family transcriptional regulator
VKTARSAKAAKRTPRRPRLREPVQERAMVTREKLLEAAIRAFASVGYDAASTREIESDAGVNRGLIAYHFKTKDALWKAAVEWLFAQAAAELAAAEQRAVDIDPVARLRFFVRAIVRFSARYPEVNRLMIEEGTQDDWRLDWLVERFVGPWYRRAELLFKEARALGMAPDMAFPHFYYILTGAAALPFSMAPEARRLARIDTTREAFIDAHADALANLLFPGGKP